MTSSVQNVLKEDGDTRADPFDRGAGSIRADRAVNPTVTFDVTTAAYVAATGNPLGRIHVNTPSINAPTMPGIVTTTRTMENVSRPDANTPGSDAGAGRRGDHRLAANGRLARGRKPQRSRSRSTGVT